MAAMAIPARPASVETAAMIQTRGSLWWVSLRHPLERRLEEELPTRGRREC